MAFLASIYCNDRPLEAVIARTRRTVVIFAIGQMFPQNLPYTHVD